MLEFPEVNVISKELNENICGKTVERVMPPTKLHKFCWFNGKPEDYESKIKKSKVSFVEGFGLYVEISFDNGFKLCFNDGVNARLISACDAPKDYQLLILFGGGEAIVFTVAMYGGIVLQDGGYGNEYYLKSKSAVSPLSEEFDKLYYKTFSESSPKLSAKAFLATEQRFPGIGNGVLQDILFSAGINPKRKIGLLSEEEKENLLYSIRNVLKDMTEKGGRDTEKDIFGRTGGYKTQLSKNTFADGCPLCGGEIVKEAYLGGAVYYCPKCQPLIKD